MTVRQLIPEDLASIPPGPELAHVLVGLELSRLSGFDCVEVLKAQYRQANHERARVMAAMVEVGLCGPVPADEELRRMAVPDEFSADEVRAALVLTRRAADVQFWLAHDLVTRLPAVHTAMDAGVLDEPRARVLSEWTIELHPETARALCAELLPRAPGLTTGQLIEQIKKLAIALDPDWARRRYEQAVAERKVVGSRNPDGSANLSGHNLPVDRVAAACGHIDGYPPCSGTTSTPPSWPAGDPCTPNWPASSPPPSAAPSGASRSLTSTDSCYTAESPEPVPPAPHPHGELPRDRGTADPHHHPARPHQR
ncbi:MAG: DUF222 domain-containing protein [Pseudonocardiales bacterium]|nr:DUF222 domain-containing protein [Pseudonocardiales bacterium]